MLLLSQPSLSSVGTASGWNWTYALVVDDLDDSRETAVVGAIVLDEDDTADLDEAPVGLSDGGFAHFDCNSAAGGLETEGRRSIVFGSWR